MVDLRRFGIVSTPGYKVITGLFPVLLAWELLHMCIVKCRCVHLFKPAIQTIKHVHVIDYLLYYVYGICIILYVTGGLTRYHLYVVFSISILCDSQHHKI